MSIKAARRSRKCPHCSAPCARRRKSCPRHLKLAREKWAARAQARRANGRCAYCTRRATVGLRCDFHRGVNLARTRAWHAAHPEYEKQQWREAKAMIAAGRCPRCNGHASLAPGRKTCRKCLRRRRDLERGVVRPWEGTSMEASRGRRSA